MVIGELLMSHGQLKYSKHYHNGLSRLEAGFVIEASQLDRLIHIYNGLQFIETAKGKAQGVQKSLLAAAYRFHLRF